MKKNLIIGAITVLVLGGAYIAYNNTRMFLYPRWLKNTGLDDTPKTRESFNKKTISEIKNDI